MSRLDRFTDPADFLRAGDSFLATDAFAHDLLYGISRSLIADPQLYDEAWFGLLRDDDDQVVAAMLRTPPHPLVVSRVPDRHVAALVSALLATREYAEGGHALGGIQGIGDSARALADAWSEHTGCSTRDGMAQRFHVLTDVIPPPPGPGELRVAEAADLDLCAAWSDAMTTEAGAIRPANLERATKGRIADGRMFLWTLDGEPVSMAANGRDTPAGAGVNLVYTPPELRGNGYATRLVAALSQLLLDRGHATCFLYTDLANPTSNGIYRRVGYVPRFDPVQIHFAPR